MVIPLPEPEPVCPIDVPPAHRWGAEPKRRLWRMKRGGSVVSKGACRAAARAGDYCEPDRAQRDHWFESSKHHQRKRSSARMAFFFGNSSTGFGTGVSHRCAPGTSMGRGAEAPPVADEARRKRGEQRRPACGSVPDDYCEPDRAQRDHWFESSKHHQRKDHPSVRVTERKVLSFQ